jgi:L-ascorbate metabolism protein UlaG (beta-lactamase superfamily)
VFLSLSLLTTQAQASAADGPPLLAQIEEGDVDESYESYGQDLDEEIEYDDALTTEADSAKAKQKLKLGVSEIDKMIEPIKWFGHASFLIDAEKQIWIDPYALPKGAPPADIILITHEHRDHYSPADIKLIRQPHTVVVSIKAVTENLSEEIKHKHTVRSGDTLTIDGVHIEAVPAYNIGKDFHPKAKGHVGYIIHLDGTKIYHAGDTDNIPEMKQMDVDVALLPIGGTYTMDAAEAAMAARAVKASVAIPMHWGTIIGDEDDAKEFKTVCKVPVVILETKTMKQEQESREAPEKEPEGD